MDPSTNEEFDCVVLSGGGAKAAYGAGAAKALFAYRSLKNITRRLCFIGASSGALNAAILATCDADTLIAFWRSTKNRHVLGVWPKSPKIRGPWRWFKRLLPFSTNQPFSIYANKSLLNLITKKTDFHALKSKHLIIAVTDYTQGKLKAFYYSHLLDKMREHVNTLPTPTHQLAHLVPLKEETFAPALLASAAIPVIFPPVNIDGNLYIDGGVGNNTPTREAAYFLRYLETLKLGKAGEIYCIRLERPPLHSEDTSKDSLLAVVDRTLSIYHNVHTQPIIDAWFQINRRVSTHHERLDALINWIDRQTWDRGVINELTAKIESDLRDLGGPAAPLAIPMHLIEPSHSLGATLDFRQQTIRKNIEIGYLDMLKMLRDSKKISNSEHRLLAGAPIFLE